MGAEALTGRVVPYIDIAGGVARSALDVGRSQIDDLLPEFLQQQRWFASKSSPIRSARIADLVPLGPDPATGHLAVIDVRYADATPAERYISPLAIRESATAERLLQATPGAAVARLNGVDGDAVLLDGIADPQVIAGLVRKMDGGELLQGVVDGADHLHVQPLSLHTSNTSMKLTTGDGHDVAFKLVRRHDANAVPGTPTRALDVWKGAYLTNEAGFRHTPAVLGAQELVDPDGAPRTVSVLTGFVDNDGDSWAHALEEATRTLDLAASGASTAEVDATIEGYGVVARNHGRRLGELHVALSSGGPDSEFRGVRMDDVMVNDRLAKLHEEGARVSRLLRMQGRINYAARVEDAVLRVVDETDAALNELVQIDAIHTHGDFHLGQMLRTGDDVQIIDLEGAPALPLGERWKRTIALGDVVRNRSSYEYSAAMALRDAGRSGDAAADAVLEGAAQRWAARAKDEFWQGWLDATSDQRFRHARTEIGPELREAELSNTLYEVAYELGSRPDWVDIPLARIRSMASDTMPA